MFRRDSIRPCSRMPASLKRCLSRIRQSRIRHCVREYVAHYHAERNHQGIANAIPFPDERLGNTGEVTKSERLGGPLKYYHRRNAA